MISNEVSQSLNTDDQKSKEIESFIIEQPSIQNHQQSNINMEAKNLTNQLSSQSHVQLNSSTTNSSNVPFIIQNGNIYQLTTSTANQLNQSNVIQIPNDSLKTNPIKLTSLKHANVLNLNSINKGRIILKTNQGDSAQGQQVITTISPNSINNQRNVQQNQTKSLNYVLQNQPKQYIIANQQKKSQITGQNGSPIIVLQPTNRTIGDQNLQFLIQQKSQNINLPNSNANTTTTVNLPSNSSIPQIKTSNFQQKIYLPQTGANVVKKNVNEIEIKNEEIKSSNPNLISLLNSTVNSADIKQEPILNINQPKLAYQKSQKDAVNITPIATKINPCHTSGANSGDSVQKEEINEAVLNECILPDTRIFASLLNKDHSLPTNNSDQKNEIKYKTVLIGNTEHVILDNLQNLSDFKGNFGELKNLACSVADHLNKSVSIPAFLLIDSKSSIDKIKSLLGDININPIVIDTLSQNSQQTDAKTSIDQNTDREKFNQHHQNLIKKLSSNQSDMVNSCPSPVQNQDASKQKKISTPKRRAAKPRKPQIIINSNGTQVNKSKLTINDLIQQNAMNQSLEMEKSSEPTAKKIRTINQLVNAAEPKMNQSVFTAQPVQSVQPVQQIQDCLRIPASQSIGTEEPRIQQSNDWLDEQIQLANEFIDTLTKNDEKEKNFKADSLDLIKNEPILAPNLVNDENVLNSVNSSNLLSGDYNFEIDPFDTNLYFSSNLNDIEF